MPVLVSISRLAARTASLKERYNPRANAFGLLRLGLATAVLVAHAWPLGYGQPSLGATHTRGQTDLGTVGVYGFFVVSGFLVCGSAQRLSMPRFLWHRFLRIFPGLWVCLLLIAFVVAPLVALYENGTVHGLFSDPFGPLQFLNNNAFGGMRQYPIANLLDTVPFAHLTGDKPSAFAGSLWSLRYEILCYCMLAVLGITGVLTRAPRAVVAGCAALYLVIVTDDLKKPGPMLKPPEHGWASLPLLGGVRHHYLIYLTFLFLLGGSMYLYRHRVPLHPALGAVAAIALACTARWGAFFVIGLPAFAYLVLYIAVCAPRWTHGIGRRRDYSYGIYIYGFLTEQIVALLGGAAYGMAAFLALSAVGAVILAALSWHLVERPAMRLKDWRRAPRKPVEPPEGSQDQDVTQSLPRITDEPHPVIAADLRPAV